MSDLTLDDSSNPLVLDLVSLEEVLVRIPLDHQDIHLLKMTC